MVKIIPERHRNFFRNLFRSLNPMVYDDLVLQNRVHNSVKYLFGLILFAAIIMALVSIPIVINFKDSVDAQFNKFEMLKITPDWKTKEPLLLPTNDPKIIVDSDQARSSIGNRYVFITTDQVILKPKLCRYFKPACIYYNIAKETEVVNTTGRSDILAHKDVYNDFVFKTFLLLIPGLLILQYIASAVKYFLITFIVSLFALIICRIARYEISYANIYKTSIFAATILILAEIITIPLRVELFYIQYAVYAFYLIFGLSRLGYFEKKKPGGRQRRGEYIMLE